MPAKSKQQRDFFGAVYAFKTGKLKNVSEVVKNAAKSLSLSQIKDYLRTARFNKK